MKKSVLQRYGALLFVLSLLYFGFLGSPAQAKSFQYVRVGNKEDVQTKPLFGVAMMGGGKDLDQAFRWLCGKGNGDRKSVV